MAIDAYTGLPRSGKSYSVIKNVVLPSLREGRHVYTNIPLTDVLTGEFPDQCHQLGSDWFTDKELFQKMPHGAVVVLDELWRRWPAGMKANAVPFEDKEFLAEHGHLVDENGKTTRVVLVTQDLAQIASFARQLVAMTYRTTKLDAVGAKNRFRVDVYQGAVTGQKPPAAQLIRSTFDQYEEAVYRYYRSSTKSQTGDVGDESRADKRANIWRSPFIIFSMVAPVLLIPLLLWYISGLFSSGIGVADRAAAVSPHESELVNPPPPSAQPTPQPAVQVVEVPRGPVESGIWRVVGSIQRDVPDAHAMGDQVILRSVYGALRYVATTDCNQYQDGINWTCEIDGQLVTPWTGNGSSTGWASDGTQLVARTASVASGATNVGSTGNHSAPPSSAPVNPPPPGVL